MERKSQRLYLILLGTFFLVLVGLSFWHTSLSVGDFRPDNAVIGFVLWGLLTLVVLGVFALGFILFRNLIKLYIERRQGLIGSKLKTKLVGGALVLSIVPVVAMVIFSFTTLSRTLDKWLFPYTSEILKNSEAVTEEISRIMLQKTETDAALIADLPEARAVFLPAPAAETEAPGSSAAEIGEEAAAAPPDPRMRLREQASRLNREYVGFLPLDEKRAVFEVSSGELIEGPVAWRLPQAEVESADGIASGMTDELVWSRAPVRAGDQQLGSVVVVWRIPETIRERRAVMEDRYQQYRLVEEQRTLFKYFYLNLLSLIAVFVLFVAVWLSLFLSKQISVPIEALVRATSEVSSGHLEHRIDIEAIDELGGLVESFNSMTQRLEQQTRQLQTTNRDLEEANAEIDSRRRFTNAILESVTPAVLSVDASGDILKSNSAVDTIFALGPEARPRSINELFPPDDVGDLHYMLNRARRTGVCSREFEVRGEERIQHLNVTVSALEADESAKSEARYVIVVEDATELLRAQKAAAWHEVARRVAHEIKNPLTPIILSAERMERLLDRFANTRDDAERNDLSRRFERSTQTIVAEVQTLRRLVDEFSQFARFPKACPTRGDLNRVVHEALAVFDGRLSKVHLRVRTAPELPEVLIDADQFKRVVVNLVDNAAEALKGEWVQEIMVETTPGSVPDTVELTIADSGPGISPEDKERLFLPYFSTKERGTGLGLAIVSRIVNEHAGAIRVEDNRPSGTRFIVELPAAEAAAATTELVGADS